MLQISEDEKDLFPSKNKHFKTIKMDENNLWCVMALQNFGGGPTEAKHLCNFLGIPHSKSLIQKKNFGTELFLGEIEKCVHDESIKESIHEEAIAQCTENNCLHIYNEWKNGITSIFLPIKISFDAAWNKRSQKSGGYNSNSGFTNAIGISKKKIEF